MPETLADRASGITGGSGEKTPALSVRIGLGIAVPDDFVKFDTRNFDYENVLFQLIRRTDAKLK